MRLISSRQTLYFYQADRIYSLDPNSSKKELFMNTPLKNTTLKTGLPRLTIALTIAIATALLAGCEEGIKKTEGKGKVVDFYLSGATVTFEDCPDKPTTVTDANGEFIYPPFCSNVPTMLTVSGGLDIGTQLPFTGVLKAPKLLTSELSIVSPLTTLIANDGSDAGTVATKLGLGGINLLTVDPMTNPALLKQTVVAKQFVDQIEKVLLQLSDSAGGSLSAEQAAQAASAALAASVKSPTTTGVVDLTSATFAQGAIDGAIRAAAVNLPDSIKNNIDIVARNAAALTAAEISKKISAVNAAMANVVIGATPADTLAKLGTNLQTVRDSAISAGGSNLIGTLYGALGNPTISSGLLTQLGTAAASGQGIDRALKQVNDLLPVSEQISAGDLANLDTYKNFIEMVSLSVNSKESFNIPTVEKSLSAGQELSVEALNNVQLKIRKNGAPFIGNTTDVRVGISYKIIDIGYQLDFIISKATLTFNPDGSLASVVVPANTPFLYKTNRIPTVQGTSINKSADALTVSNGAVNLPLDDFLTRVSNVAGAAFNKDVYTPRPFNTFKVNIALDALGSGTTRVGLLDATKPRAASAVTIKTATTNLDGQGINAVIKTNKFKS